MRFVSGKHLRRPLVQELVPEAADETLHEGLLAPDAMQCGAISCVLRDDLSRAFYPSDD